MYNFILEYNERKRREEAASVAPLDKSEKGRNGADSITLTEGGGISTNSSTLTTTTSGSKPGSSSLHTSGTSCTYTNVNSAERIEAERARKAKVTKEFFAPFESLGIEVDQLNSIRGHICTALFEVKQAAMTSLPSSLESQQQRKGSVNNCVVVDFESALLTKSDRKPGLNAKDKPLPLYVNTMKQPKVTKSGYFFTRFNDTLHVEHCGLPLKSQVVSDFPEHATAERAIHFETKPMQATKIDVEIVGVDKEDFVIIKIIDSKMEGDYGRLMSLLKAYYGTVLTDPRKERIPKEELKDHMLVVAYVFPATHAARFIRARVMNIRSVPVKKYVNHTLEIQGIDDGSVYVVPIQNVFHIDEDFLDLPCKVQSCKLNRLEFFHGTGVIRKRFRMFIGNRTTFKATISGISKANFAKVELFAGRSPREENVNVLFFQDLMTYVQPKIFSDQPTRAELCYCDIKGNAWFHIPHEVSAKILSYGSNIEEMDGELRSCTLSTLVNELQIPELYVAKSKEDGTYYRARVLNVFPDRNEAMVEYIDWGNKEAVDITTIHRVADIDLNLSKIPPQAIKVRIDCIRGRSPEQVMKLLDGVRVKIWMVNETIPRTVPKCDGYVEQGGKKVTLDQFIAENIPTSRNVQHTGINHSN